MAVPYSWQIESIQEPCGQPSIGTFDFKNYEDLGLGTGQIQLCKFHHDRTKNRARAVKRRWDSSGWGR